MLQKFSVRHSRQEPSAYPDEDTYAGSASFEAERPDFERSVPRSECVQNPREFISRVDGYRTFWPAVVFAGLLAVILLALVLSYLLFRGIGRHPVTQHGQGGSGWAHSSVKQTFPKTGQQFAEARSEQASAFAFQSTSSDFSVLTSPDKRKPGDSTIQLQSDDADPDMALQFAAVRSVAVGDNHMKSGDFERAASVDSDAPKHAGKLQNAKESLLAKQVHELLLLFKAAVENEDMETLITLLDETDPDFVRRQAARAKRLFRHFEDISSTFSDVKIQDMDEDYLAVKLHCKVRAASPRTGRSVVLFDDEQNLAIRKVAGTMWKICGVE